MNPKLFLSCLLLLASYAGYSQTFPVSGKITDAKDNAGLPGATVLLIHLPDSVRAGAAITDAQGAFSFQPKPGRYLLRASFLGFQTLQRNLAVADKPLALGSLALQVNTTTLKEVQITEKVPVAVQKGDTTEFNAQAMKVNKDANSDELVEKVPGVVIQDGVVKARGQDVKKVRVDGREFFGDDAMATLKNLPAEVVDKIQLVEEQSEQSRLSGVDDGNRTMSMNIVTRPDRRNGVFGRLQAGAGTDDRYQAGGTVNIFKPSRRLTLLAGTNNINQQGFGMEDFLGGGMGGGRSRGSYSGGGGFGGMSGLTTTHNAGINYSEEWGKKITLSASYFGNYTDNSGYNNSFRTYFQPDTLKKSDETETEFFGRRNTNHRINSRFEYKIDSANTLFVQPRLSFQMNDGYSNYDQQVFYRDRPVSESENETSSDLSGYNMGVDMIFRHQFAKKGRSASVGINFNANRNDNENYTLSDNTTYSNRTGEPTFLNTNRFRDQLSEGLNLGTNLSFNEPLTKTSSLSVNYNYAINRNDSDARTYDFSEEAQDYTLYNQSVSNTFNNNSFSHQLGLGYNYFNEKINFNARAAYQYAELDNVRENPVPARLGKGFVRVIPNAYFTYRFDRNKNLRIFYNGNTSNPSLEQLQDVIDKTNPLAHRIGNPDLDQSYRHYLNFRYTATNTEKSSTFVTYISSSLTQNQIVNNRFVNNTDTLLYLLGDTLQNRASLSRAENLDGNYNLRAYISYSLPLKFIKSNLNFDVSADVNRNPGISTPINTPDLIQSIRNYSYSQNYGGGLTLSSNISQNLDFNLSTRGFYSYAYNTLSPDKKTTYYNQFNRARLNWVFYKGFVFNTDYTHRLNTSVVAGASNVSFHMLNLSLGKKVFKKQNGDIRLSVFDALGQNKGFRQNVGVESIEEVQSMVLQRYYMLTFTYNIRKFGNGSAAPAGPGDGRDRGNWNRGDGRRGDGPPGGGYPGGGSRDF
ncbi:MAG: outer membrane beta-barrel protein [Adhaeribacter sp.]